MAVLGLILLAAAGVLTAAVVTSNTNTLSVDLWGVAVSNITLGVVFVAGMITTVLAVIGLGLLMGGLRRGRRLRHERKSLRRENEQLAQRVESNDTPSDRTYESAPAHDTHAAPVHDTHTSPSTGGPEMTDTRPVRDDAGGTDDSGRRRFLPGREQPADPTGTRN